MPPSWRFEEEARRAGRRLVAGIDEVGRGSLAGPVFAAAVILHRRSAPKGIDDSKLIAPAERRDLARRILSTALAVGVGSAGADEVDRINVRRATLKAMARAVEALPLRPDHLLIDAAVLDEVDLPQVSLVKGDRRSYSIAAASIVAKAVRDSVMEHYASSYPVFGFECNRGYGTAAHRSALTLFGPSPIHRMTFRCVRPELQLAFDI